MTRTFALLLVSALPGLAQIGAGIKVGLPFTDIVDASRPLSSSSGRYLVGPQLELRLPWGIAIEADALYSNFNVSSPGTVVTSTLGSVVDGSSWEFPVMVKKKFGRGIARPFIGAGASFRRLGDIGSIGNFFLGSARTEPVRDRNNKGFVFGGGIELKLLFLRISPEVRFTRWGTEHFTEGVANVLSTNKSQGQLLIGFSF